MTLKSLVVVASGDEACDARAIAAAVRLGKHFGAHVHVTPAFPDPSADLVAFGSALGAGSDAAKQIARAEAERLALITKLTHETAAREGLSAGALGGGATVSVAERGLQPVLALAGASALADVVVFDARAARTSPLNALFAEALLLMRAPILLLKGELDLSRPAAIAWDGSTQAGRAIRAALPLLHAAPSVLILHNADEESIAAPIANAARLQQFLAQHGVSETRVEIVRGHNVAQSVLGAATAAGCGLLAAGAYGRPRLMELVLGGATRGMVTAEGPPNLLLAH